MKLVLSRNLFFETFLIQEPSRRASITSQASLSVEAALECFDFLDAESDDEDGTRSRKQEREEEGRKPFPQSGPSLEINGKCPSYEDCRRFSGPRNTSSLESKYSFRSNLNSLESKSSGKSSLTNTLEEKSTQSSEGSKSSDSSTLEDKSRSSGQSSFSNTLEDKSGKSTEFSSGTSTLELDMNGATTTEVEFIYVEGCIDSSRELQKFLYFHLRRIFKLLQVSKNISIFIYTLIVASLNVSFQSLK